VKDILLYSSMAATADAINPDQTIPAQPPKVLHLDRNYCRPSLK
jgi:hypothetical protein